MSIDDFNNSEELDPDENLRLDNKVKRLELELKGAKFIEQSLEGIDLPPEIESQMLDQILAFEKLKSSAKEIDIIEFLGHPKFESIDRLSSEEIILENERLLNLMAERGLILTSLAGINDAKMYRFITEEFLYKKTIDIPIKGFIRHFVYEEFYPNEKINAEKTVELFFQTYFSESSDEAVDLLCRDNVKTYLNNFRSLYYRTDLKSFRIDDSRILKIKGDIKVNIDFEAFLENSRKSHTYSVNLDIEIRKRRGHWQISKLEFPKL